MNKYTKLIHGEARIPGDLYLPINVDVYNVLEAFDVKCSATQHAIKKLLMPGERGEKTTEQDLKEAIDSLHRAVTLQKQREQVIRPAVPVAPVAPVAPSSLPPLPRN